MDRVEHEKEFWEEFSKQEDLENKIADKFTSATKCVNQILPYIKNAKSILEIGCGIGRLTIPIAKKLKNSSIYGIDISEGMIKIAKEKGIGVHNLEFYLTNGRNIVAKSKFDAVYSMTVFQHIDAEGVENYIKETSKVLNEKGVFRFQFVEGDENSEFSQQYSIKQIMTWLQNAGFKTIEMQQGVIYPNWTWVTAIL